MATDMEMPVMYIPSLYIPSTWDLSPKFDHVQLAPSENLIEN
jgi:hypothetical protein